MLEFAETLGNVTGLLDATGNAQWIGHVLKGSQLVDNSRRRHHIGGKLHAIDRHEVLDMIPRYDVPPVENKLAK